MKLNREYRDLARRIGEHIELPPVVGLHLPKIVEDAEKPDEFGFVFLEDGSVGPFYTSLEDSLPRLWHRYPDPSNLRADAVELTRHFGDATDLAASALALGAFNAISQHLFRRASFSPSEASVSSASTGIDDPLAGDRVGMVGYFCPLVERMLEKGVEVLVVEKKPERVEIVEGLELAGDASELARCDQVLCTASTLINDSLEDILGHSRGCRRFSLIGPSGSGLPDLLFERGVDSVGGLEFFDLEALREALQQQVSWGHAGHKYQLTPEAYPGVGELLRRARSRS